MKNTELYQNGRNLGLISLAKFLSGFASYIYDIGVVIYLFQETESVTVIGGFFVAQLLPAFLILVIGGIIDKYNKKVLMIISNIVKAVLMACLLINRDIWCIYAVTFGMNLILEFEGSTISALIANVFAKGHLFKAASVINFVDSFSMIAAPLCASVLALYFRVDINLVLSCALYMVTAFSYGFITFIHVPQDSYIDGDKKLKVYMNLVRNKRILGTVFFWNIFMFCIGLASPLEVSMIEEKLQMPSQWYGIGNAVEGMGMLVASAFVLGKIRKLRPSTVIVLGLICAAMSQIVIGISGNIWVYFLGAVLGGITATFCPLGFKTEIQMEAEPESVGRTFAVSRFFILLSRMGGSLIVGQMLKLWNIRMLFLGIAGILIAAAAGYGRYIWREK